MQSTTEELCKLMRAKLRFFHFLVEEEAETLAPLFDCRQVNAGETLWEEGDEDNHVVFVASGRIEEKKETEFEGKQVVIGVYTEGAILGEFGILDGQPRAFTAVALEDSKLLTLNRENFDRLTSEHPDLGMKLLKGMLLAVSTRLRKAFERLAAIF